MSTEIGKIEKPEAEPFRGERRLYLVPLVFAPDKPPADYTDMYERYWKGVEQHVSHLENRIGSIAHIYHESIPWEGDDGLKALEQVSPKSFAVAKRRVEAGGHFEALEDAELLAETSDWQRCLMIGLQSRKAGDQVWSAYDEASRKRYEHMIERIEATLKPGEAGLLFVGERHRLQFPPDVRVFYVAPPALDEIDRWLRDRTSFAAEPSDEAAASEASSEPEPATPEAPATSSDETVQDSEGKPGDENQGEAPPST
jgi:hypothetical protein